MMKDLVFVTNNKHKVEELSPLINKQFNLISLADIGCSEDIEETADTLEENARLKARFVNLKYGYDCFADDTGLEIVSLNGRPGVYSARYAGESHDFEANLNKVLQEMYLVQNRNARFRTAIALIINRKEYIFEGIAEGIIIENRKGREGFGYDPIFVPKGFDQTFAEMSLEEKNKISHRARAVEKLVAFLRSMEWR
jgi:XTP/dITP diphosphohydrolase